MYRVCWHGGQQRELREAVQELNFPTRRVCLKGLLRDAMKSLLSKFKSPGKQKKPAAMEAVAAAAAAAAITGATDELSPTQSQPTSEPAPLPSSASVPASVSPPTVQAAAPMAASSAPAQAQGRTVLLQQCLDEIEALGHEHVDLLQNMCVEALMPPVR